MAKFLKNSIGEIKGVDIEFGDIVATDANIKDITNDEILLTFKNSDEIPCNEDDKLDVIIYCSNGVFTFSTTIIRAEFNFPYVFCYAKTPTDFDIKQDREFFRTKFNLKTSLTLMFHNGQQKVIECNTFDISGSGTSLILSPSLNQSIISEILERPDINKYAKLKITLHFPEREVSSYAEYILTRELNTNSELAICSFKFTTLTPTDCDFITKQCFSKQLQEQNKQKIQF